MKVIFNGDDFGITRGCNYAILDCFEHGLLRSASVMVNMPAVDQAVQMKRDHPDLSTGIHFNLTVGRPLTHVPSLIREDGTFNKGILRNPQIADPDEIRQELQAQMDTYLELFHELPDHINSHHGLEQIPAAKEIMEEFSRHYDLPLRGPIYSSGTQMEGSPFFTPEMFMPSIVGPVRPEDIIDWLESMKEEEIVEVPGHPGYVDADLLDLSSLTTGRCQDARNFCSDQIRVYMETHGMEPADYRSIPCRKETHESEQR